MANITRRDARAAKLRATRKFAVLHDLRAQGTPEARKEARKLNDYWDNRVATNVRGYHKAKNAKPGAVHILAGAA